MSKRKKSLSKKARRQQRQRQQLVTMLSLFLAVSVIIGGVIVYNKWKANRIDTLPADQRITASINGKEIHIPPYSACEVGAQHCTPSQPFTLDTGDIQEFIIKVPEDISNHDWSLLKFYPDPGANTETYFTPNQATAVKVKTTADKVSANGTYSPLEVIEIRTTLIGHDARGEQTPYSTIWSIGINRNQQP